MRLSVIVPVLNEQAVLPALMTQLLSLQTQGCEVIVVDGGSTDGTAEALSTQGIKVVPSARGRARQMNSGVACATGETLLFLHADTQLPAAAVSILRRVLTENPTKIWGRFDVAITGGRGYQQFCLNMVAGCMNLRSRITGIATGDQAMFIRTQAFNALGGFPDQPLMEDIALSARLRRTHAPLCLSDKVQTSGRRWISCGIFTTIFLMWRLRWRYWRGESAEVLAECYRS